MNVSSVAKFVVAAVTAGAASLSVAIADGGFSSTDAITVVLVVLGALGVYAVPNKGA
jgi:hypothetical protein